MRHFLDLEAIDPKEVKNILALAHEIKDARKGYTKGAKDNGAPLDGHILAMIFEKSSTRTRVSFDVGMRQLGGSAVILESSTSQLGRGESVADTARVLSGMVDAIMLRANSHKSLVELAKWAKVPVINGLTDRSHPCQIMADLLTLEETGVVLKDAHLAWVGDGNNVLTSFIEAAVIFGFSLSAACPIGYQPDAKIVAKAVAQGAKINVTTDAKTAVKNADCVITDTWVSMGDTNVSERMEAFAAYQVNEELMAEANADAFFMHCLPAHRGEEVTDAVIDGAKSLVFQEAENRIHAQKAILRWCLEK